MISRGDSNKYSGVILAGGENIRYNGTIKAKLIIEGKPIIEKTLQILNRIFDDILIVTNSADQLSAYNSYRMVPDIFRKVGPLGGLHSALNATERERIFMVASDMPWLSEEIIWSMIRRFDESGCEILIPRHKGLDEPLHAIYSRSILYRLENFLNTTDKFAIRDFLKLADVNYMTIEVGGNNPFLNINRPEDMKSLGSTR